MPMRHYTLDANNIAVPVTQEYWIRWATSRTHEQNIVAQSTPILGVWISTVFMGGMDIAAGRYDEPMLFETLMECEDDQTVASARYSTWADALIGHAKTCDAVISSLGDYHARLMDKVTA